MRYFLLLVFMVLGCGVREPKERNEPIIAGTWVRHHFECSIAGCKCVERISFYNNMAFTRSSVCYSSGFSVMNNSVENGSYSCNNGDLVLDFSIGHGEHYRFFKYDKQLEMVRGNTRLLYTVGT